MVRANRGRFAKGNKEGRKFQKGYSGKQMTYHELCIWVKKKADNSPRISNLLLDHCLGKPEEHVQQERVVFILQPPPENKAEDAEVIEEGQLSLPVGREEEEGQELV